MGQPFCVLALTLLVSGIATSVSQAQLCGHTLVCDWPLPNVAYYAFDDVTPGGNLANGIPGGGDAIWQADEPTNLPASGLIRGGSQTNDQDFLGGRDEHYRVDLPRLEGAGGLTISIWFNQNLGANSNAVRTGLFNSRELDWTLDGVSGTGGLWGVSLGSNGDEKGFDARINSSFVPATADPGTKILPATTLADGTLFDGFPTDNTWHHAAFTWDGQTGRQRLYYNGQLLGEGINETNVGTIDGSVGWRIGDDPCCFGREFTGTLDELGVWDSPLSEDEIASIYAGGLNGVGLIPVPWFEPDPVSLEVILQNLITESGATRSQGDLTGDGAVNLADFREWKINSPLGGHGSADAVPEPGAGLLAGPLLLALGGRPKKVPSRPSFAFD